VELQGTDIIHFFVFVAVLLIYYRSRVPGSPSLKPRKSDPFFQKILASKSSIRRAAQNAGEEDFSYLESCLRHPDDELALYTSQVLSKMDHPRALHILMNQISQIDQELSDSGSIPENKPLPNQDDKSEPDPELISADSDLEEWIHPKLLELNKNPLRGILSLSKPSQFHIIEGLWSLALDEKRPEMERYYAVKSLCMHSISPSRHRLRSLLESPSRWVIMGGLELCAEFPMKESAFLIENLLRSRDDALVIEAIYGLVCIGLPTSKSRIQPLTTHSSRLVQEAARYAMERIP